MISVPSGVRVWLAGGVTDIRRGMNGLTLQIQEGLRRVHTLAISSFSGAVAATW
jgi:hypothetical protein